MGLPELAPPKCGNLCNDPYARKVLKSFLWLSMWDVKFPEGFQALKKEKD